MYEPAVWPWVSCMTLLSQFLTYKMSLIIRLLYRIIVKMEWDRVRALQTTRPMTLKKPVLRNRLLWLWKFRSWCDLRKLETQESISQVQGSENRELVSMGGWKTRAQPPSLWLYLDSQWIGWCFTPSTSSNIYPFRNTCRYIQRCLFKYWGSMWPNQVDTHKINHHTI